jgi:hypothetical protein
LPITKAKLNAALQAVKKWSGDKNAFLDTYPKGDTNHPIVVFYTPNGLSRDAFSGIENTLSSWGLVIEKFDGVGLGMVSVGLVFYLAPKKVYYK